MQPDRDATGLTAPLGTIRICDAANLGWDWGPVSGIVPLVSVTSCRSQVQVGAPMMQHAY